MDWFNCSMRADFCLYCTQEAQDYPDDRMITMELFSVRSSRKANVNKKRVSQQAPCVLRIDIDLGGISIMLLWTPHVMAYHDNLLYILWGCKQRNDNVSILAGEASH